MVFAALLGIMDIVAAWLLVNPGWFVGIAFALGVFHLIKGILSLVGSAFLGPNPLWIWMDITDVLVGLALMFVWAVPLLWIPLTLKGAWSLITGW